MKLGQIAENYEGLEDADEFGDTGFPDVWELDETLKAVIRSGKMVSAEPVGDSWSDDHIPCIQARINMVDEYGETWEIEVTLMWCGQNIVGGLHYCPNNPKLLSDIHDHLMYSVND